MKLKKVAFLILAVIVLVTGVAIAGEYRADVFGQGFRQLDIHFSNSQYDNQLWDRSSYKKGIKYHDTQIIFFEPESCMRIQTGSYDDLSSTDTMLYFSYSNDEDNNEWIWFDDDSGYNFLSEAYLRYVSGTGQRRVRIRTTGFSNAINNKSVNIHIKEMPFGSCPTSGYNVIDL